MGGQFYWGCWVEEVFPACSVTEAATGDIRASIVMPRWW